MQLDVDVSPPAIVQNTIFFYTISLLVHTNPAQVT